MASTTPLSVLIVGAGCIGATVGAVLVLRGKVEVRFLMSRPSAELDLMRSTGVTLVAPEGTEHVCKPALVTSDAEAAYRGVGVIIVCTKRQVNTDVAHQLVRFAAKDAMVCLFQNGLDASLEFKAVTARARPDLRFSDAVVSFNAIKLEPGRFRWVSARLDSTVVLDGSPELLPLTRPIAAALADSGLDCYCDSDLRSVQCGKLLINLVNAPNALAGCSTLKMFTEGGYKAVWRTSVCEAKAVMATEGITPRSPRDRENGKIVHLDHLLSLPGWLLGFYLWITGRQLDGKTSMLQDIEANRDTEVDYITGAVSRWGHKLGVATPVCDRLVQLVHDAEAARSGSPKMTPTALSKAAGL